MTNSRMELLFLDELEAEIERSGIAYVPCGLIEWHGPQLAVGCDYFRARALCERVAAETGGVVLPPMWVGCCGYAAYRGSIVFSAELVIRFAVELLRELEKMGFRLAVFILGHDGIGQEEAFSRAVAEHGEGRPLRGLVLNAPLLDLGPHAPHAGVWETAESLAACPESVDLGRFDPAPTLPKYAADPADYTPGLSPRLQEHMTRGMAATSWDHWERDLPKRVTPGYAEALLAADAASLAAAVRVVLGGGTTWEKPVGPEERQTGGT